MVQAEVGAHAQAGDTGIGISRKQGDVRQFLPCIQWIGVKFHGLHDTSPNRAQVLKIKPAFEVTTSLAMLKASLGRHFDTGVDLLEKLQ